MPRTRRRRALGAVSRVAIATLLASLAACQQVDKSLESRMGVYASMDEARNEGGVAHGWVPDGLPAGTTDLRVAYLDDGAEWGDFTFPTAQGDQLRALLGPETTSGTPHCGAPGRFEWWPRVLLDPIHLDSVHQLGLHIYPARDGRRTFAVNWDIGKGYYWRE